MKILFIGLVAFGFTSAFASTGTLNCTGYYNGAEIDGYSLELSAPLVKNGDCYRIKKTTKTKDGRFSIQSTGDTCIGTYILVMDNESGMESFTRAQPQAQAQIAVRRPNLNVQLEYVCQIHF